MNQAQESAARKIPWYSQEYAMLQSYCSHDENNATNEQTGKWPQFKRLLLKVKIVHLYSYSFNWSNYFFVLHRYRSHVTKC